MSSSPTAAEKALNAAIRDRAFAAAYLLHGDDDYLKDDAVRRIVEAAVDPATRDFNLELRRGADLDAETLGSLLDTPPMMADRRVVVIREVSALRKDVRATLDRYLQAPAPDVVLVLVAPAGARADKTLLERTTAVEFEPLSGARIPKWIAYYVEHDLRSAITPEAVRLLQEAVGTDLAQLKVELDKLASFRPAGPIDEAAVGAIVGVRRGETVGGFLDAVARRDAAAALALVEPILQQPKTSAVLVVMALTTQTLALAWGRALRARGHPLARLTRDFFDLLKEAGSAYTGRSWSEAVATWVKAVDGWSPAALDDALDALLAADAALKETRLSSDQQLLSTLVLTLCGSGSRRRAA